MKSENMDHLPTDNHHESPFLIFKYVPLGMIVSLLSQWIMREGFHLILGIASSLLIAAVLYLANNFWFPAWFPKDKPWPRYTKWLKP